MGVNLLAKLCDGRRAVTARLALARSEGLPVRLVDPATLPPLDPPQRNRRLRVAEQTRELLLTLLAVLAAEAPGRLDFWGRPAPEQPGFWEQAVRDAAATVDVDIWLECLRVGFLEDVGTLRRCVSLDSILTRLLEDLPLFPAPRPGVQRPTIGDQDE